MTSRDTGDQGHARTRLRGRLHARGARGAERPGPLDADRRRSWRRGSAAGGARPRRRRIDFLDPGRDHRPHAHHACRTPATANSSGSEIPARPAAPVDPGHRARRRGPARPIETSIRNVAYALLSGADGWMFDGEDALGQVSTMSLDNQRNLKLAIDRDPVFLKVAEQVAAEMNKWAEGFFGRPIIADWRKQLDFTTKIFRARGLHLDDRHVRHADGAGFSASIVDAALYIVNNHAAPAAGRRVAGPLPAEDPDRRRGRALERHPHGARAAPRPAGRARSRSTCSSSSSRPAFS